MKNNTKTQNPNVTVLKGDDKPNQCYCQKAYKEVFIIMRSYV